MTSTAPTPLRPVQLSATGTFSRPKGTVDDPRELDFREWVMGLWGGRHLLLGSLVVFLALGALYLWWSTPIFQSEALLQIVPPKAAQGADPAYTRMESQFAEPADPATEIEILGSNLVLGRTVQALDLDVVTRPVLFPVLGRILARRKGELPRLAVASFEIPDRLRGAVFKVVAQPGGTFAWRSPAEPPGSVRGSHAAYPQDALMAVGRPGQVVQGTYGGETLRLQVRNLEAQPGQVFTLEKQPLLDAITEVRNALEAAEKGAGQPNKTTNLLALSYDDPDPERGARILNDVMMQYLRQNAERKTGEISRTLELLQKQLPEVHTRLTLAENQLNRFRARTGSVDIPREADLALQQASGLSAQITALKQKKEDMLRTYREGSDVVATLNAQIAKLEGESAAVNQRVRSLPATQQEFVRLSREVQVNTELYTSLLDNIQQLQIARAGEGNSARIVDAALPGLKPVKPRKAMMLALFAALGLAVGAGLVMLRRLVRQEVKDHRLIETKLGLPVFVTIPHSRAQEEHYKALRGGLPGRHLLAFQDPEDLATESLRSLRTLLNFTMGSGPNRVILVTGPSPKVGKSFLSSNLAVILAQSGARVLVIDADLRKGNLHRYFGLPNRLGGLSEVLAGLSHWNSAVHPTEVPGLHLMTTGEIPRNPSELLMSHGFSALIEAASREFDFIVLDAPPLLPVTDATLIGSRAGTALLVVRYGQHTLDELRACQSRITAAGIPLVGCVFNDLVPTGLGYYDRHYLYTYHYRYGQADHA